MDWIPGGLAWLALIAVPVGAYVAPLALLHGVAVLALYTAARMILAAVAAIYGLRLVRRAPSALERLPPSENVYHLVLLPNYGENENILRRSLDRLADQAGARERIVAVLAMEAAEPGAADKGERLRALYTGRFRDVIVTLHPAQLPGEIACKSANLRWALVQARREVIEVRGIAPERVLVTVMDADTLWPLRYFEALDRRFAAHPNPHRVYWQAPIRYHANVWQTHPLLRILHAYSAVWELAYLAAPWWRALPMSSYSLSLCLLDEVGAWDPDAISDEWHMFIKSFFRQGGVTHVEPIFMPFLAQATGGVSLRAALRERYQQTLRHAWGAQEIGYAWQQVHQYPAVPRDRALGLLLRVAHDNILAGAGWVVLFVGGQLPLLLHPAWMAAHLDHPALLAIQGAVGIISVLMVVFWAVDRRIRPPRPGPWTWREQGLELLSLPLAALLTLVCLALPVLHAQTRLALGRSLAFRVTPKT